jgi:hypothetical protein
MFHLFFLLSFFDSFEDDSDMTIFDYQGSLSIQSTRIQVKESSFSISNCYFFNFHYDGSGAAISHTLSSSDISTFDLQLSVFSNCSVRSDESKGGAVFINSNSANITNVCFSYCSADLYGQAFAEQDNFHKQFFICSSSILKCSSPNGHSSFITSSSFVSLLKLNLSLCQVIQSSLGRFLFQNETTISFSNFLNCSDENYGFRIQDSDSFDNNVFTIENSNLVQYKSQSLFYFRGLSSSSHGIQFVSFNKFYFISSQVNILFYLSSIRFVLSTISDFNIFNISFSSLVNGEMYSIDYSKFQNSSLISKQTFQIDYDNPIICYFNPEIINGSLSIPLDMEIIPDYRYMNYHDMIRIIFHENVSEIGNYSFYNCSNLRTISFGVNVQIISNCAFQNCVNLVSIELSILLQTIYFNAFNGCSNLDLITIHSTNIIFIDSSAFSECINLKTIIFSNSVINIVSSIFSNQITLKILSLDENIKRI